MMDRVQIRYSEAFKRQVVSDLESGRLCSQSEARERYGIGGTETLNRWLRAYGKNHLLCKVVRVETTSERDQFKALKRRIRELEKALADSKVQEVLHKAYVEIACEQFGGNDVAAFKKKLDARLCAEDASLGRGRKG
jgi:transposase-like protein